MSPRSRLVVPGYPHHVIHRGNNRRRIASFASDYLQLIRFLMIAVAATGCEIHAAALLANHVHLLVTPPTVGALAQFVRRWAQRYARARNRKRDGSGKLFECRYDSHPLRDDAGVAAVTRYIDLNPVRAGLVADPREYRWSTAALHLGLAASTATSTRAMESHLAGPAASGWPVELWRPSSWYLSLGSDGAARAATYRRFLEEDQDWRPKPPPDYPHRLLRPDGSSAREAGALGRFYETGK